MFSRISIAVYVFLLAVLIVLKSFLYFYLKDTVLFGGGNDSEYYHAYATGEEDQAVNLWPIILRALNEFDLYSREYISFGLLLVNLIVLPILMGRVVSLSKFAVSRKVFWVGAIWISIYPTLYYYCTDIYRDVFLTFVFLCAVLTVKKIFSHSIKFKLVYLVVFIGLVIVLYFLRPYLGFAVFTAFVVHRFYRFEKNSFILITGLYLLFLNIIFGMGLLNPLVEYRSNFFESMHGGSNLGIGFNSTTVFVFDFIKSFAFQLLGLFYAGPSSVLAFLIEGIPFILMLIYVIKNRAYCNQFINFLVVFFVIYSTIWLIGNDNLGTAVRLRIFNYLAIAISALYIYQIKFINKSDSKLRGQD